MQVINATHSKEIENVHICGITFTVIDHTYYSCTHYSCTHYSCTHYSCTHYSCTHYSCTHYSYTRYSYTHYYKTGTSLRFQLKCKNFCSIDCYTSCKRCNNIFEQNLVTNKRHCFTVICTIAGFHINCDSSRNAERSG